MSILYILNRSRDRQWTSRVGGVFHCVKNLNLLPNRLKVHLGGNSLTSEVQSVPKECWSTSTGAKTYAGSVFANPEKSKSLFVSM